MDILAGIIGAMLLAAVFAAGSIWLEHRRNKRK